MDTFQGRDGDRPSPGPPSRTKAAVPGTRAHARALARTGCDRERAAAASRSSPSRRVLGRRSGSLRTFSPATRPSAAGLRAAARGWEGWCSLAPSLAPSLPRPPACVASVPPRTCPGFRVPPPSPEGAAAARAGLAGNQPTVGGHSSTGTNHRPRLGWSTNQSTARGEDSGGKWAGPSE